jgi:hypothetical protein
MLEEKDVLQVADSLIFAERGKHLTDVEAGIIVGVLNNHTYSEIANNQDCTEGHIKDVSYKLWQSLSRLLGEEVNKRNLKTTLLRRGIFNFNIYDTTNNGIIVNTISSVTNINLHPLISPSAEFLQGHRMAKRETAIKMREMGFDKSRISKILDLSIEEINSLIGKSEC